MHEDLLNPEPAPSAPSARKRRAWAAENPGNAAMREEAYAALRSAAGPALGPGGGRVLDAGCGTGWWLARLLADGHPAARLWGCDRDAGRVAAAASRAPGADVRVADLRALPYDDGAFDVVLLMTVVSSLGPPVDRDRALAQVRRVLAPGGCVLIWEPRIPTPWTRATRYVGRRDVARAFGSAPSSRSLTLAPPLARRLPGPAAYARLARVRALRTHRLLRWPAG